MISAMDEPLNEEPATEQETETKFTVTIRIADEQKMYFVGDIIRIDSFITGECAQPAYQWQVLRADSVDGEWEDIPDATAAYYEFAINEQNCADSYRVNVVDLADEAAK